jgi:hypothetical protein
MTADDIDSLDRHEGVSSGCYEKKEFTATATANGEAFQCLVYIDPSNEPGRPCEGYLEKIVEGARDRGLPEDYVRFLQSFEASA